MPIFFNYVVILLVGPLIAISVENKSTMILEILFMNTNFVRKLIFKKLPSSSTKYVHMFKLIEAFTNKKIDFQAYIITFFILQVKEGFVINTQYHSIDFFLKPRMSKCDIFIPLIILPLFPYYIFHISKISIHYIFYISKISMMLPSFLYYTFLIWPILLMFQYLIFPQLMNDLLMWLILPFYDIIGQHEYFFKDDFFKIYNYATRNNIIEDLCINRGYIYLKLKRSKTLEILFSQKLPIDIINHISDWEESCIFELTSQQ